MAIKTLPAIKAGVMHRIVALLVLFANLTAAGQIDQRKRDSLARSIDSSARVQEHWQDSFKKVQDSIYQSAIDTRRVATEQKAKESKERQQAMLRIGIIAVIVLTGTVVLLLRRRPKD